MQVDSDRMSEANNGSLAVDESANLILKCSAIRKLSQMPSRLGIFTG